MKPVTSTASGYESPEGRGQILAGHIEAIVRLAQAGEPGKRLQLPGGIDVLREQDALVFQPRRESQ